MGQKCFRVSVIHDWQVQLASATTNLKEVVCLLYTECPKLIRQEISVSLLTDHPLKQTFRKSNDDDDGYVHSNGD